MNLELYDATIVNEGDDTIYRISIISNEVENGKRKGVSLDTCVELTHMISPLLDVTPPVSGDYRLEVGTAGIERKLTNIAHFKKSIGEKVSLVYSGKEKVRGVLKNVEGSQIFVASENETVSVEFNEISKARTYFEW
jgi:ribosome maturation factor RimP